MPAIVGTANTATTVTQSGLARRNNDATFLYTFTTFTFTSAGLYGRVGPTLSQIQTAYAAGWPQNTSYLTVVGSGIQKWTVPSTGLYRIQAAGAPGGRGSDFATGTQGISGGGTIISANFYLTIGDIIYILVGQKGGDAITYGNGTNGFNSDTDGGGGGGTFVARRVASSDLSSYYFTPDSCYVVPLIVAGGGGGGSSDGNGINAVYTPFQTISGAVGENWGYGTGGGWNSYPTDASTGISGLSSRIAYGISTGDTNNYGGGSSQHPRPGSHFLAGGLGGVGVSLIGEAQAGFGGGGGACDEGGSGGGGWIGGINGDNTTTASQGGSSYVSPDGSYRTNDGYNTWASTTTPNGYCTITYYGQ